MNKDTLWVIYKSENEEQPLRDMDWSENWFMTHHFNEK